MINIISEEHDVSTFEILEYLISYNADFKVFNVEKAHEISFIIDNQQCDIGFKNTFHRRGRLNSISTKKEDRTIYSNYLYNEENPIVKALEFISKDENFNYVGSYNEEEQHNKIIDLHLAKKIGLKIPKTLVTNNRRKLRLFFEECNRKVITKCIKYPLSIKLKDYNIVGKNTFLINHQQIRNLCTLNSLGLYQEHIEKKFEIRIFVYKNSIFSMAIFSQQNSNTKIDYRDYDENNPNRLVPFLLPENIELKLKKFFKIKKINCGSVDMIVDVNNDFIFLENNPQGQFDWLSKNCNYYIEEFIALDLIKNA